jgi:hypothetical protein
MRKRGITAVQPLQRTEEIRDVYKAACLPLLIKLPNLSSGRLAI